MKPYLDIPVETARQIARDFDKQIVVICAWNYEHGLLHTVTYGKEPTDKINAASAGEICAKTLGMDLDKKRTCEDFRLIDAARNAQLFDLAERAVHVLRSYEFGNSATKPAKLLADDIEAIIKAKTL